MVYLPRPGAAHNQLISLAIQLVVGDLQRRYAFHPQSQKDVIVGATRFYADLKGYSKRAASGAPTIINRLKI